MPNGVVFINSRIHFHGPLMGFKLGLYRRSAILFHDGVGPAGGTRVGIAFYEGLAS